MLCVSHSTSCTHPSFLFLSLVQYSFHVQMKWESFSYDMYILFYPHPFYKVELLSFKTYTIALLFLSTRKKVQNMVLDIPSKRSLSIVTLNFCIFDHLVCQFECKWMKFFYNSAVHYYDKTKELQ